MKCLIYSYWLSKPVPPGALAGSAAMKAYAKQVGADYRCDYHDPFMDRFGVPARWFDKLRPAFDPSFATYDRVLVVDHDVFPVDGITANIFEEEVGDFGMCEEPNQPEMREKYPSALFSRKWDDKWTYWVERVWGCVIPRDANRRSHTWNAGVILFSHDGLEKLREEEFWLKEYRRCALESARLPEGYATEQAALNTLAFCGTYNFTQLSVEWNRQLHYEGPQGQAGRPVYDRRTADTKFVHVQLTAADHNSAEWHHALVNGHRKLHVGS